GADRIDGRGLRDLYGIAGSDPQDGDRQALPDDPVRAVRHLSLPVPGASARRRWEPDAAAAERPARAGRLEALGADGDPSHLFGVMSAAPYSGRRVPKPWGYELIWAETDRYVGKLLHIERAHQLSYQYHERKDETIHLLSGVLELEVAEADGP